MARNLSNPLNTVIGLKIIMALTGLILFGFTLIHMLGNLQIFLPPEKINHYAYLLQSNRILLWTVRIVLLLCVLFHIEAAVKLTRINRASRPQPYRKINANGASFASRTMFIGGLVVAFFIVFHLLHFTAMAGPFNSYRDLEATIPGVDHPVHDVHQMMVTAFQNPIISLIYLVSVFFLCLHLHHGAASLLRSLGVGNHITFVWQNRVARAFALFIFLGMAAVPVSIFFGAVK